MYQSQGQGQTPSVCSYIEKNTSEFLPRVILYIKPHEVIEQSGWSEKDTMLDQIQQNYRCIKLP